MKFITYNAEAIALCLALPDWGQEFKVEIEQPFTDVAAAVSHRESRRRFGRTSRYALEFSVQVRATLPPAPVVRTDAAYSTSLRLFLQRLKGEPVVVPMWMDGVETFGAIIGQTGIFKTATNPVQYGSEWIPVE